MYDCDVKSDCEQKAAGRVNVEIMETQYNARCCQPPSDCNKKVDVGRDERPLVRRERRVATIRSLAMLATPRIPE